jgi:hypothetical protein
MDIYIADGEGNARSAGVDSRYRLKVAALIETESNYATTRELKFNINTGDIELAGTKTTVLYFKNNELNNVIIDTLIYNLGTSAGGSGDILLDVIRNPTVGDIITNANDVQLGTGIEANLNYSSNRVLECLAYKGASGETPVTDGLEQILTRNPNTSGRIPISPGGGLLLGRGNSLAINYTPPVGNTSQFCQFALNVYVQELR